MSRDPRVDGMARLITVHSLSLKPGDRVLVDATDESEELVLALIEASSRIGAVPFVQHESSRVRRAWLLHASDATFDVWFEQQKRLRLEMDAIISLRSQDNCYELVDVPAETTRRYFGLLIKLGLEAKKPGRRSTYSAPAVKLTIRTAILPPRGMASLELTARLRITCSI